LASLRDSILSADDIQRETVDVPEWGVTVEVRGMTGEQNAAYMDAAYNPTTGTMEFGRVLPELVIACTFDPDTGEPVFEPADRDALGKRSASALERIGKRAAILSGLGPASLSEAKGNS
jgi:hypothetical protein